MLKKLFTLASILSVSLGGENFYQLLGVKRNATEKDLKKAFKKASLKYHPDKNPDQKDWASDQFAKASNAYEILSDPELRRVYDRQGEEGVKEFQKDQAANDERKRQWDRMRGIKDEEDIKHGALFAQSDVLHINGDNFGKFYRRQEIWAVYFYKSQLPECQQFEEKYKELASKMYGIIQIAAVDCNNEEEVCEEFTVYDPPQLMVFQEDFHDDGEKYEGKMELPQIQKFATKKMQSFVQFVSDANFEAFLQRDPDNYKVLLFTERKSTAPLFKALSKKYKGKLNFGEVRASKDSELIKNFQVTTFPSLVVVVDAKSYEKDVYDGEMNVDRLSRFLSNYTYKKAKQVKTLEWEELTRTDYRQGQCSKKASSNCFILCSEQLLTDSLRSLPERYENDKVDFVFYKGEVDCKSQLGGFPAAFLKPKFAKYYGISELHNIQKVQGFIDNIIGGGGELSGKLEGKELAFEKAKEEL